LKDVKPRNVYAGDAHSACISAKNNFYTWGKGSYGRLGHGFTTDVFEPQMVEELENIKIIDAALGSYYTFVITSSRTVYQWGGTEFPLPTPIPEFRNK
jgi:E3 ubiquitin-protein ligase HERC2